ncbi:hypothetical protein Mal15_60200 [Stieleria maiorica]|uniref:Uncharacterized protein n=1 Tax=Stieleria maiorica TaxID=2795974 RepID=A0A5B9ML01_9BACT|nr:hypothetical protein [Stieleria maiorica]QEG01939.1 hypothetical protein Mal15_60200 [Stieleria maiorica]
MSTVTSKKRKRGPRRLTLDTLEARRLFHGDPVGPVDDGPAEVRIDSGIAAERGLFHFPAALYKELQARTQQRFEDVDSVSSGLIGNAIVFVSGGSYGDGCEEWKNWMVETFPETRKQVINVQPIIITPGVLLHKFVRFQLRDDPSGQWYVADPWRDAENPIWQQEVYMETFDVDLYEYDSTNFFGGQILVDLDDITDGTSAADLPADEFPEGTSVDPQRCIRGEASTIKVPESTPTEFRPTAGNNLSHAEIDEIFNHLGKN